MRRSPDSAAAHKTWREERDRLFRNHSASPIASAGRDQFSGLEYFEYDPAWRTIVQVKPLKGESIRVDLGADGEFRFCPVATTSGLSAMIETELTIYRIEGYGGGIFLPFADATSGDQTFGGGRYLYDTIKGAELGALGNSIIVDFNFAYNPSCSYSAEWVCPLAPEENRVSKAIHAGERGQVRGPNIS